jgi:L-alanine-DL-glutamate epimerase-like enolase superfamily enzyme
MKVKSIDFIYLDVPFSAHTQQYMDYWLPEWRISQICKITLDNDLIGWGETLPNYTWARVPDEIEDRVLGRAAAELLWQDDLGAGVQMALFDAVGKSLGVPAYRLLGHKVRDWCPISWWAMDMPPEGWAAECADAVRAGYMTAKLKARPWFDIQAGLQAIFEVVPSGFSLDLDFNETLDNAANAVKFLATLAQYEQVAMFESPIPQRDVAGNAQIRARINRPVAMHYGVPPLPTAMQAEVVDGFVLSGGASKLLKQAHVCEEFNKPFWLQLVGTGLTTTWAAHCGAVLSQARWPAITCLNIWEAQLIKSAIEVRGGFYRVPEAPGLGIEIDEQALETYRVAYSRLDPPPHLLRYVRKSGEMTYYALDRRALRPAYAADAQPISEPGSTLEVVIDDGSPAFRELYHTVQQHGSLRRRES